LKRFLPELADACHAARIVHARSIHPSIPAEDRFVIFRHFGLLIRIRGVALAWHSIVRKRKTTTGSPQLIQYTASARADIDKAYKLVRGPEGRAWR
jgi:hypothetical protein